MAQGVLNDFNVFVQLQFSSERLAVLDSCSVFNSKNRSGLNSSLVSDSVQNLNLKGVNPDSIAFLKVGMMQ